MLPGKGVLLPRPDVLQIRGVLAEALPVRDVEIQEGLWPLERGEAYDGALTYLHKVKDGRDIYFFANSRAGRSTQPRWFAARRI